MNYDHRFIEVSISTHLTTPEVKVSRRLNLEDDQDVARALETLTEMSYLKFAGALVGVVPPTDPLPGDESMLQATCEYMAMPSDDSAVVTFSVLATVNFKKDWPTTVANALRAASRCFLNRGGLLLGGVA